MHPIGSHDIISNQNQVCSDERVLLVQFNHMQLCILPFQTTQCKNISSTVKSSKEHHSVFHSKDLMMYCIRECVNSVKLGCKSNRKQSLEKSFDFIVGCMFNGECVKRVRVVYKRLKGKILVVTACPVKLKVCVIACILSCTTCKTSSVTLVS